MRNVAVMDILPCFKLCKCRKREEPDFEGGRDHLLSQGALGNLGLFQGVQKRIQRQKEIENQNPMFKFGYGMVAHFTLIEILIGVFFVMALLSIPMTTIYTSYDTNAVGAGRGSMVASTLGNMGFGASKCSTGELDIGTF